MDSIHVFLYYRLGDNMNIIYKRKTLYVYLKEDVDELLASKIEDRVSNIMGLYSIDKLVIDSSGRKVDSLRDFE